MKNSSARFKTISNFQFVQSCACNSKFDEMRGDGNKNIYLAVLSVNQQLSVRSMDVCCDADTTDSFIMDIALMDGTDHGLVCFGSYLTDEGILWLCIFNHNKVIGVDLVTRQLRHQLNNIFYPNSIIRSTKNSNVLYVGGGSNHHSPFIKEDTVSSSTSTAASSNATAVSSSTSTAASSNTTAALGKIYELNIVINTCRSIECGQLTTVTGLATIGDDDVLLASQLQDIVVVSSNSSSINDTGYKEEPAKLWNGCSVDDSSSCYIIDKFSKWDDFKVVAAIYRKIPTSGRRLFTSSMDDHDHDDASSLTSWLMACMMNCFSSSSSDEVKDGNICSADLLKPLSEDDRLDDIHFLIFDSSDYRPYHFKLDRSLLNAPEGVNFDGHVTQVQRHGGRIAFINFRRDHVMIIDDAEVAGIINQSTNSMDDVVRENIDYLTSAFGVLEAKLDWKLQQKDEEIESLTASLEAAQKNCSYLQRQLRSGNIVYNDGGDDVQIGDTLTDVMLEYNDFRKKCLEGHQSDNSASSCSENNIPPRTAEQERLAKAKNDLLNTLEYLCVEENTVELYCLEQLRIQEEKVEDARKEKRRITKEKEVIFARLEQLRVEEEADLTARLELKKIDEERADLARLQQMRIEEQKAESARLELLRIQEQKAELERIINSRISDDQMTVEDLDLDFVDSQATTMILLSTEAEKEELARLEQLRSLVEKAELVRLDHLRIEEEKEDIARSQRLSLEEEKEELARLQQRRIDEERAHNDRMQQLKLKEERAEKTRQDQLRLLEEKAEQARLVQLQIVEEKAELARLEQRRIEEEKVYLAKIKQIKIEEKNAELILLKDKDMKKHSGASSPEQNTNKNVHIDQVKEQLEQKGKEKNAADNLEANHLITVDTHLSILVVEQLEKDKTEHGNVEYPRIPVKIIDEEEWKVESMEGEVVVFLSDEGRADATTVRTRLQSREEVDDISKSTEKQKQMWSVDDEKSQEIVEDEQAELARQAQRIELDELKRTSMEEDELKRSSIEEDELKRTSIEEDELKRTSIEEDELKRSSMEEDELKRPSMEEDELKRTSIEEDELKRSSIEEDELKRPSMEEDELKRTSIEEDELKRTSMEEQNTKSESSEQSSRVKKEEAQIVRKKKIDLELAKTTEENERIIIEQVKLKDDKKEGVLIEQFKQKDEKLEIFKLAQNKSDREESGPMKRSTRGEESSELTRTDQREVTTEDESVEQAALEQRRMVVEQAERIISDQIEKEKIMSEQIEKEKIISEQIEKEKVMSEQIEKDKVISEQIEKEKVISEQIEKDKVISEQIEKDKIISEQTEKEKVISEQIEKESLQKKESAIDVAELKDILLLEDTPVPEQLKDQRTAADCK